MPAATRAKPVATKAKRAPAKPRKTRTPAVEKVAARRYAAAKIDRLTADWVFSHRKASDEIREGLPVIRSRARELEENDAIARRYLSLVEANIVGKSGFTLRHNVDESLRDQSRQVRAAFYEWLDHADVSGHLDGPGLQRHFARTTARDGEALGLFRRGREYRDGVGVMLLESDHIPHTLNDEYAGIIMGVRLDGNGRPVSYMISDVHPGGNEYRAQYREHRARDVLHLYRTERPSQVRAVSWMAGVMIPLRMLHGYQEAELVAARVSSCQMGFYKVPPGNDWGGDGTDGEGNPVTDASPGTFERLPDGWDFQSFNPSHPTTQYHEFVKSKLREIAVGLEVSYSALISDGSDANYSSMREMSILEREGWMVKQSWFARAVMARLYSEWLLTADLMGRFDFDIDPFIASARWSGRTWPWVDPQKDAAAHKIAVELGLTSPQILAAEKGLDYDEVCRLIAEDEATRAANGLPSLFAELNGGKSNGNQEND